MQIRPFGAFWDRKSTSANIHKYAYSLVIMRMSVQNIKPRRPEIDTVALKYPTLSPNAFKMDLLLSFRLYAEKVLNAWGHGHPVPSCGDAAGRIYTHYRQSAVQVIL